MTATQGMIERCGKTKGARPLRRQRQLLEGLECHADEFGHGLRVRFAMTRSELCLGKITEADACGKWILGGQPCRWAENRGG